MSTLLVPVDFSDVTDRVVEVATRLATALGSRVRLLHVAAPDPDFVGYEVGPQVVRDQVAAELREEHRAVQALADRIGAQGLSAEALMVQGATVATILEQADKIDAEMIVLGSHGHGALYRALLGSVSEGVMRHGSRPVLIVPTRKDEAGENT